MDKPPQKVNKIVAKFFLWAWKVNTVISKKREFISPGRSRTPAASEMEFFVTVIYATNSSILDIAGDPRPTLAEYFSMAAFTLVPSAICPLHMVLIMKKKSEQCIKAEIQAKIFKQWILKTIWDKAEIQANIFKQWILKTILWRHYYSIKGLEKAILKYIPKYGAMV